MSQLDIEGREKKESMKANQSFHAENMDGLKLILLMTMLFDLPSSF